jgi:Domain of unknown function (DUF4352)
VRRICASVSFAILVAVVVAASPAGAKTYRPGQKATTSGLRVTVYGIQEPWTPTNQFDRPTPGNHYVAVDVQVTNPSKDQQLFSALSGFHLIDSGNRQYDVKLGGCIGLQPSAPDGQLPSKQPIRGFACFEIPDGSTKLKLRIQGSFTAEGALFQLTTKTGTPIPPAA